MLALSTANKGNPINSTRIAWRKQGITNRAASAVEAEPVAPSFMCQVFTFVAEKTPLATVILADLDPCDLCRIDCSQKEWPHVVIPFRTRFNWPSTSARDRLG